MERGRTPRRIALASWLLVLGLAAGAHADLLDEGLDRLDRGDYAAAQQIFESLRDRHPDSPLPLYYLGIAASRQDRPLEATLAFVRAAELDPEYPWLQANLGIALYRLGELDAAEGHLLEALLQGPDDAEVLLHLGLIDARRGQYDRAIRMFEEAAELDPLAANVPLHQVALAELARGDADAARDALSRAVAAEGPESAHLESVLLAQGLGDESADQRPFALAAGAGIEFDDNLTVQELDGSTGVSDIAGIFDFSVDLFLVRKRLLDLSVGYDFYQSVYREVKSLNYRSHAPSLGLGTRLGPFRPNLAYRFSDDTLGGTGFLDSQRLYAGVEHFGWIRFPTELGVELEWLDFAQEVERDARRVGMRLAQRADFLDGSLSLIARYRPEWQDAQDPELDYTSHSLWLEARAVVPLGRLPLGIGLSWELGLFRYHNITERIGARRWDDRNTIRAGLRLPFLPYAEATLDYLYISSQSNLPELDYNENVLTVRLGVWR